MSHGQPTYDMADQPSGTPRHFELEWGGRTLAIDTGKFAGQANGAATVRYGDTVVLATAVLSANSREGIDFFPLMVDFEERLYAAGARGIIELPLNKIVE